MIDWSNPFGKAKFHAITEKSKENDQKIFKYTHGYGAGDVNGDGRMDILEANGWYEQPKDLAATGLGSSTRRPSAWAARRCMSTT